MNTSPAIRQTAWDDWRHVLAIFIASRLLLYGAAIVLPYFFTPGPFSLGLAHVADWAGYWTRWDANWYVQIAQHGYDYQADTQSGVAFFPLLPLLIRTLSLIGLPAWLAALMIANGCTLAALMIFHHWLRREFGSPVVAEHATALLAFCPQSCWFILGYSEPLYLLTALAALVAARQQRWWAACGWGLAHGLTRSNGITLALPLLCFTAPTLWTALKARDLRNLIRPGLATIGAWGGHAAYLAYLWVCFGTWQANQITSKAGWGVSLEFDWLHLGQKVPGLGFQVFTQTLRPEWIAWSWTLAMAASLFAFGVFIARRLPLFWSAYLIAFWSLFLLTTEGGWLTGSMGRFAAALFPIATAQALFAEKHRWAQPVFLAFNAGAAFINLALLFTGYHIV